MPELPEVETMAAALRRALLGRSLSRIRLLEKTILRGAAANSLAAHEGARIVGLTRRGKFILIHLSNGAVLLFHLKMTGRFLFVERDARPGRWERLHLELDGWEGKVAFVDPRKFGYLAVIPPEGECPVPLLYELGPDALQVTAPGLAEILGQSSRPVKALLLDQRVLAGLGNIYVDEALHRAGIHPRTPASAIGRKDADRLHGAMVRILRKAIDLGGSSVRSYRDSGGTPGGFQRLHRVYGRRGEPCRRCGGPITYSRVASRGTHHCPACQKAPSRRSARRGGKG